ncbi:NAD(P)H-dependent flavin oxidoreductase [Acetobacter conturbans]|uniref:Propionate 3-nitronate monooxygenase n=1 Tax=Acetobacter conturbans TaxID=1737472 RepID=A0ABX0JXN7_9PROT|nr:nitronate monooxygenase [Acetobacter conturbans]NHN88262.1 nitronate monooxygenase [Acetobacter conturbans]
MLTRRLGLDLPIFQAPMAGVATPELAAAVSEAGGLGNLGLGAMSVGEARSAIRATRALTGRPFGVNLFCHKPETPDLATLTNWLEWLRPEFSQFGVAPPASLRPVYPSFLDNTGMLEMLLEERPAMVSFHFGLPSTEVIRTMRRAGIQLVVSVTSPEEAVQASAAGVDALIVQGYEAGGHRGLFDPDGKDRKLGTRPLLAAVQAVSSLPLIAAGGVMTGSDVAAMLEAGAIAAQLGTAFVTCEESAASPAWRAALADDARPETVMVRAISGRPARGLRGRFAELEEQPDCPRIPPYPYAYDAARQLATLASAVGNTDYAAFWAGANVAGVRPMPAARLVTVLGQEAGL